MKLAELCLKCNRNYQVMQAGVLVKELYLNNEAVYRLWSADLLQCPGCGHAIVTRFAEKPLAQNWEPHIINQILEGNQGPVFDWKEYTRKK